MTGMNTYIFIKQNLDVQWWTLFWEKWSIIWQKCRGANNSVTLPLGAVSAQGQPSHAALLCSVSWWWISRNWLCSAVIESQVPRSSPTNQTSKTETEVNTGLIMECLMYQHTFTPVLISDSCVYFGCVLQALSVREDPRFRQSSTASQS